MAAPAGWTPVTDSSAWTPVVEPASKLQRFAQSWWDHSVLKHPIDSAVGLVKSLVTFPDYHQLSDEEKAHVDTQMEKAFHEAAHPTPELAGQVASTGSNAALIAGATIGLGKGLGAVVDSGVIPQAGTAIKAGVKAAAPDVAMGTAKAAAGTTAAAILPGGEMRYVLAAKPVWSGVTQVGRGASKGFAAGKAAFEQARLDRLVAAAAERVPAWQNFPDATPPGVQPAPAAVAPRLPSGRIPGSFETPGNFQGMETAAPPAFESAYDFPAAETPAARPEAPAGRNREQYQAAARTVKGRALARWLKIGGISYDDALQMTPEHWAQAATGAGVNTPSTSSIGTALEELRKLHEK